MAVGGQGGGVLTSWIADLATQAGYAVQMTSVAGVAQRTGATIYYVEMAEKTDKPPVFALSPSPGDIDILIASELMEAGRAIIRGFVTEDRTTLIASTHRVLAISEKQVPGDGRAESDVVTERFEASALHAVCFDMQAIADQTGSMISASLFGGLARSNALPFHIDDFERVIQSSGRGAEQSLAAFRAALNHDDAANDANAASSPTITRAVEGPEHLLKQWHKLTSGLENLPATVRDMAAAGLTKTVDYQDIAYGEEYIDSIERFVQLDDNSQSHELSLTACKYLANAMCYDDIIRVADLKTRSTRDARLRHEQQVDAKKIVRVTEYFHPRAEEFCATLPASLGAWLESSPCVFSITQRLLNKGRRIRTDGLSGFTLLWMVAGMKRFRRKLLRHRYETQHINDLTERALAAASSDYKLAIEILKCQRLIKGYSDTHARGQSKFARVLEGAAGANGDHTASSWMSELREAALQDEQGEKLDALLARGNSARSKPGGEQAILTSSESQPTSAL